MTTINRNAPCHCGSGKKYKNCCLKKDKVAAQAKQLSPHLSSAPQATIAPQSIPEHHPKPPDPQQEAADNLWDKLQAANYEGQIALFSQTLAENPELMSGEMAFEFLNTIYYKSVERDERDRFEALAETLREQLPDIYAAEAGYILGQRITNAIAEGRFTDIPAMTNEIAQSVEKNIDEFFNLMDQLAYHNQLTALISATTIAWPQVKDSTRIFGIDEFANQARDYIVFNYLNQTPNPASNDQTLVEQIAPYGEVNLDRFADYIARLTQQYQSAWTMADFQFDLDEFSSSFGGDDEDEEMADDSRLNLYQLTFEFMGYLYHQERVPYAKGELARAQIYQYILARHDGKLKPQENLFAAQLKPKKRKRRKPIPRQPKHPLCPDRNTLDRFLADMLNFINPQHYKATTTLELIPIWLRFLESRQLIDTEQREQTLFELHGLDTEFLKVVKSYPDPALRQAMENWRSNAEQKQETTV